MTPPDQQTQQAPQTQQMPQSPQTQPQQTPPRQPPPQPPTAGYGYWESDTDRLPPQPPEPATPLPEQEPWRSPSWEEPPFERWDRREAAPAPPPPPPYAYEGPYGYGNYGGYGDGYGGYGGRYGGYGPGGPAPGPYGYGPMVPQQTNRSKTRLMVLIASTVLGMLLAAGGVYYMVEGESGGDSGASSAPDNPPRPGPAGESPEGGKSGGAQDGGDDDGKRFAGKWRSAGGGALTIGKESESGRSAGKHAVTYDRAGRLSTCPGVGEVRKSGAALRLALKCVNGKAESELGGDAALAGKRLKVEWDGGSSDAFVRQGGRGGQGER